MQETLMEIKFEESQSFRQKGLYVVYFILLALLGLFIYADVQQIILDRPFGSKPASDVVLVFITFFILALLVLFYVARLQTIITEEGVQFRWVPFQRAFSHYKWDNIIRAEIIKYGFVGYGLRLTSFGTVHNVAGNKGLQLTLKSGGRVVLGTQKPAQLEAFLQQINKLPKDYSERK
jgi:hypothetical protein